MAAKHTAMAAMPEIAREGSVDVQEPLAAGASATVEISRPSIEKLDGGDASEALALMSGVGPKAFSQMTVFRVVNPGLEGVFDVCRQWFARSGLPSATEWGYHATTRQNTGSIIWTGFNASLAGKSHGTALGKGIYLANNPKFANGYAKLDASKNRCMFICRVLKGGPKDHKRSGQQTVYHRDQQVLPMYLVYY